MLIAIAGGIVSKTRNRKIKKTKQLMSGKDILKDAQKHPGIKELVEVYKRSEKLLQISDQYHSVTQPTYITHFSKNSTPDT